MTAAEIQLLVDDLSLLNDASFVINYVLEVPLGASDAELARGVMRFADRSVVGEVAQGARFKGKDGIHLVRIPGDDWREEPFDSDGPYLMSPFWYLDLLLGLQDTPDSDAGPDRFDGLVDIVVADEVSGGGILSPTSDGLTELREIETVVEKNSDGLLNLISYVFSGATQSVRFGSFGCALSSYPDLAGDMPDYV